MRPASNRQQASRSRCAVQPRQRAGVPGSTPGHPKASNRPSVLAGRLLSAGPIQKSPKLAAALPDPRISGTPGRPRRAKSHFPIRVESSCLDAVSQVVPDLVEQAFADREPLSFDRRSTRIVQSGTVVSGYPGRWQSIFRNTWQSRWYLSAALDACRCCRALRVSRGTTSTTIISLRPRTAAV
jgi:hypothetical protein